MYIKQTIKEVIFLILTRSGLPHYFRRRNKDKVVILMYHGVVKKALDHFCWTQIEENKFKDHIVYLKKHYHILKLSDVLNLVYSDRAIPENTVVITFDDGLKNNFTIAYPILKQMNIPATIFLATGCVSNGEMCWPDRLYLYIKYTKETILDLTDCGFKQYYLQSRQDKEQAFDEVVSFLKCRPPAQKDRILNEIVKRLDASEITKDTDFDMLSWEEIEVMDKEGLIEFGGHTVSHNILSQMDEREMEREILDSCKSLEKHLGKKCQLFAYPNGLNQDFNEVTKTILKKNGLMCGLSTIPGLYQPGDDVYEIPRIGIGADISFIRFQCLVSGTLFRLKHLMH